MFHLSHKLTIPVTCNLYISPNEKYNCLGKHSDLQETFIFQMINHKLWNIYQDHLGRDLKVSNEDIPKATPKGHRCLTLNQGETLYIPANTVHKVECDKDTSRPI